MRIENKKIKMILRMIGNDVINNVEKYIKDLSLREYITFENSEQINNYFSEYLDKVLQNCSESDIELIRYYTGIAFNYVNSILRNKWDYEINGTLTSEKKEKANDIKNTISKILLKTDHLPSNIIVYRGTNINSFKDYGIKDISELESLIGKYYYESSFTSTSLIRKESFFDRNLEWHEPCNIEIEYFIPEECSDGIPLITNNLSYSKSQTEYLLDSGTLSKIIDVKVDKENNKAYIKMAYIPKVLWDLGYANYKNNDNNITK